MITETQLVTIDNQLRFVLFGLECVLNAEFSVDAVSEKHDKLWAAKHQLAYRPKPETFQSVTSRHY